MKDLRSQRGLIFAVDETALHDGPGLRMTIYLKGCPLNCIWCHSPESKAHRPEIVWYQTKCKQCGECIKVCPEDLRIFKPVDNRARNKCRLCALCIEACKNGALEVKGYQVTAGGLVDQAVRIAAFFKKSGGGVTLTGGEPTLQPKFALAILKLCRRAKIHTAMETSGYASWSTLKKLASFTDLFLYDIKHPDNQKHKQLTGVSNTRIFSNLRRLVKAKACLPARQADIIIRVPLIPSCNDTPAVIKSLVRECLKSGARKISLLPFNPVSAGKYTWFHRAYLLDKVKPQDEAYIEDLNEVVRQEGMEIIPL